MTIDTIDIIILLIKNNKATLTTVYLINVYKDLLSKCIKNQLEILSIFLTIENIDYKGLSSNTTTCSSLRERLRKFI